MMSCKASDIRAVAWPMPRYPTTTAPRPEPDALPRAPAVHPLARRPHRPGRHRDDLGRHGRGLRSTAARHPNRSRTAPTRRRSRCRPALRPNRSPLRIPAATSRAASPGCYDVETRTVTRNGDPFEQELCRGRIARWSTASIRPASAASIANRIAAGACVPGTRARAGRPSPRGVTDGLPAAHESPVLRFTQRCRARPARGKE